MLIDDGAHQRQTQTAARDTVRTLRPDTVLPTRAAVRLRECPARCRPLRSPRASPSSKARTSIVSPGRVNFKALSRRLCSARNSKSRSPCTGASGHGACGSVNVRRRSIGFGPLAAPTRPHAAGSRPDRPASSRCARVSNSASLRRSALRRLMRSTCASTLRRASRRAAGSSAAVTFANPARIAVNGFFNS